MSYQNNNKYEDIIKNIYLKIKKLPLAYDGNKKKLLNWIAPSLINELQEYDTILDGFSGTGIISSILSQTGHTVYSNDIFYSAYALTTTLNQNPGEIINEKEIQWLSSHRCIDGIIFDSNEIFNDINDDIHIKYPGILTQNESTWIKYLNKKIEKLSLYKQLIAHCAIRGISTIIPFNSANGSKKFQYRINQKDKYGQRCLGFYYNSSYEIEYIKWFEKYVEAFNQIVIDFSSRRVKDAITYQDDIFNIINSGIQFDAAYFDPPYGRKNRISYEKMYSFQEELLEHSIQPHAIFTNPEDHRKNFINLLKICENIPRLIFSYDNKSWNDIEDICLICKSFGRTINIISKEHCHGKIPMTSHNSPVIENLIVSDK